MYLATFSIGRGVGRYQGHIHRVTGTRLFAAIVYGRGTLVFYHASGRLYPFSFVTRSSASRYKTKANSFCVRARLFDVTGDGYFN